MDGVTIFVIVACVVLVAGSILALALSLNAAQSAAEERSEGDAKLIKQLADTLAVIAKDESQNRRLEIATVAPAAAAYAKAVNQNGLHRSHVPIEQPDEGENITIR